MRGDRAHFSLRCAATLLLAVAVASCGRLDVAAELAAAQERYEEGDYATAAIHIRNVLQAEPNNVEARLLRGHLSMTVGDAVGARNDFERAMESGAATEEVVGGLVDSLLALGSPERAVAVLDDASAELDATPDYWTRRGEAFLAIGEYARAAEAFDRSRALGAETSRNLTGRAMLATVRGDLASAQALLDQAVEAAPRDSAALSARARFYLRQQRLEEAAADLERAALGFTDDTASAAEVHILLMLVQVSLALDDPEAAARAAARLDERAPNAAASQYSLALLAYAEGRLTDSRRLLQDGLTKQPNSPVLLTGLGAIHLALGELQMAEQSLLAALRNRPEDEAAIRLLAEARMRQQRPEAALDLFRLLVQEPESSGSVSTASTDRLSAPNGNSLRDRALSLNLARAYLAAQRDAEAVALLTELYESESDPALVIEAGVMLIAADLRAGDEQRARARAAQLVDQFPNRGAAHTAVASLYERLGEHQAARDHLEEALRVEASYLPARLLLVQALARDGELRSAREALRAGLDIDPESVPVRAALGEVELALGNVSAATAIADALHAEPASQAAGYVLRAQILLRSREYDEAVIALEQAFERAPSWPLLTRRLETLRLAQRDSEVESLLRSWVDEHPEHATGRLALASVLQVDDRVEEAIQEYERTISIAPANAVALNNLAWLYHVAGRPEALETARKAHALAPDNPAVLDTLGWILARSGREGEGIKYLETAAELSPGELDILYHVAHTKARLGQTSEARALLERLLGEPQQEFTERASAEALLETLL